MAIELAGEEPFLKGGLNFVEAEDTSQVRIDLSRIRLADPLTVVGSALVALRLATEGKALRLILPQDNAEIENLSMLGLFNWLEPVWCEESLPVRMASPVEQCLSLCRLDLQGARGAEDFVTSCMELLGRQTGGSKLPRLVGQILVEVIENALVHSRSPVGTYAAARFHQSGEVVEGPGVEVAVGDAGVGMLGTLGPRYQRITRSVNALREAFKPRVSETPDKGLHSGAGLPLVHDIIHRGVPHAELVIFSGDAFARLRADKPRDVYETRSSLSGVYSLGKSHFERWGTWARLRIPVGG